MRSREPLTPAQNRPQWIRLLGAPTPGDCTSVRYWDRPVASPGPSPAQLPDRQPVFLVHGFAGADHHWSTLRSALAAAGFETVIALRHNAFHVDIRQIAEWLVEHATRAMLLTGSSGVHLVGHSMGGLVVREAAQSGGLAGLATTVVTIATPHRGAGLARFLPGPAARQLRPRSAFLTELNLQPFDGATCWINVHSTADRVVPPSSGTLAHSPAAPGQVVEVEQNSAGHRSIVHHPRIVGRVRSALIGAEMAAAERLPLAG